MIGYTLILYLRKLKLSVSYCKRKKRTFHIPQVPSTSNSDGPLKPVIVYIHGGGFSKNAGTSELISPDYLIIEHDIILVTMNYRLHLFGNL